MFTGIIQAKGVFRGFAEDGREMRVEAGGVAGNVVPGGSLAVDGVCLTVVRRDEGRLAFNVLKETLQRTRFRNLRVGDILNLECPLALSDPLGGHLVSGHVDFTGKVKHIVPRPPGFRLSVTLPADFRPFIIAQGSVAVNGVSLTAAAVGRTSFEVELIPETVERTNLRGVRPGDLIHVECDMIGKYVYNFLNISRRTGSSR
ncbi:MAG: riboflavin synthase [Candidatus Aminicenantes bacterium]|nr:riboflavin synthase [Candidatus Aminicenantes bacterium]